MSKPEAKDKSDAPVLMIRLQMADPRSARPLVERELARTGAIVLAQRGPADARGLNARLDSHFLGDLLSRLAKLGKVLEQPEIKGQEAPSLITVRITW